MGKHEFDSGAGEVVWLGKKTHVSRSITRKREPAETVRGTNLTFRGLHLRTFSNSYFCASSAIFDLLVRKLFVLGERLFRPSRAGWAKGSRQKASGAVELLAFPGFCTKAREACN
jgi:hypothetical protein